MITITKESIYFSPFSLRQTRPDSENVKEIELQDIVLYMGEDVELGEDVTFGRLFEILIFHKEFFNILYCSDMHALEIDDFIKDFEGEYDAVVSDEEYKIMFSWICNTYRNEGELELFDYVVMEGYGRLDTKKDKSNYPFALSYFPLYEFKDKLVICNNGYYIDEFNGAGQDMEELFKAKYKPFTVYDIFSAILRDISYYGKPEDRDREKEMYDKMVMEADYFYEGEEDFEEDTRRDIDHMIEKDFNTEDKQTFWDKIYPKDEPTGKSSQDIIDETIIALSENAGLTLEEQMDEAVANEEYEKANRFKRLIERRDANKH
jgi:hypothetical protein